MTEPRFEELINLYLDNEIGRHELGELKHAIRDNVLRRQKFERACQLHQAARKALTSQADGGGRDEDGKAGAENNSEVSRAALPSARRYAGAAPSGGGTGGLQQKQSQARRNAAVPTLAGRQLSQGAASAVDLRKISLESLPLTQTGGGKSLSFFNSTAGMVMAGVFTLVGVLGLYLLLRTAMPGNDGGDGAQNGDSAITQGNGPIDEKEMMRELQSRRQSTANPAEAMQATLYQSAAGQPVTSSVQVDYSSTQTETAPPEASAPTATSSNETPANPNTTVTVRVSQATLKGLANSSLNTVNTSQLQITLPTLPGAPADQDVWVKMSLPPIKTPPADSGNAEKSGNETTPTNSP